MTEIDEVKRSVAELKQLREQQTKTVDDAIEKVNRIRANQTAPQNPSG